MSMKLNQHRFKTDFHFIVPKMRFFPQHCTFSDNSKHTTHRNNMDDITVRAQTGVHTQACSARPIF